MDRAHRLGQKRTVNVYRLLTRDSLEDKIMGLQRFKLDVANSVVNQDNVSLKSMDAGRLLDLFTLDKDAKAAGAPLFSLWAPFAVLLPFWGFLVVHLFRACCWVHASRQLATVHGVHGTASDAQCHLWFWCLTCRSCTGFRACCGMLFQREAVHLDT